MGQGQKGGFEITHPDIGHLCAYPPPPPLRLNNLSWEEYVISFCYDVRLNKEYQVILEVI